MQSLGKIAQCAPAVGAKMWCLFFYRQDAAKRQTAGIKFTHRPKIRFGNGYMSSESNSWAIFLHTYASVYRVAKKLSRLFFKF